MLQQILLAINEGSSLSKNESMITNYYISMAGYLLKKKMNHSVDMMIDSFAQSCLLAKIICFLGRSEVGPWAS